MKGRAPNADERRWMDRICEHGCIVCRLQHDCYSPAEPHHLDGKTKPGAHYHTIPLCPEHHRHGMAGPARHKNRVEFESAFGTELDLYHETVKRVAD